ncbi:MAG: anhydro-N-acetylmuramic acid kinase [Phycisphaerae bacterium]|nr:MAG: anhydro-N-acetylmuramic acid kinase [Phycisphaerae bacterium]
MRQEGMRRAVGCMTGTSLDGIDVALVEVEGVGLSMRARFVRGVSHGLGEVGMRLRHLAEQHPMRAHEIAAMMYEFAGLHVSAIRALLGGEGCDLVSVHGQTVFHKPPLSWQVMQPARVAREIGAKVVFDLRQADLAAGGQGAPITPIADAILFRDVPGPWGVVNLGGFCNVTLAPGGDVRPEAIMAKDVCACNQLLDSVARTVLYRAYDEGGEAALRGRVHEDAFADLEGILASQGGAGRSLGTGDEPGAWVSRWRAHMTPDDLCATACAGIAEAAALATADASVLLLAGGGTRNQALVEAMGSSSSARVGMTDEAGVPAMYREAACFAVLGALCEDRVPITLPQVTGCASPAPVSGVWVM